jgi:hypothetical protein
MNRFARLLTTWVAAAIFAVASVAWATAGPEPVTPVAAMDHGHHGHADADLECADQGDCSDAAGHDHESDTTCCAFSCHVVAFVSEAADLTASVQAGRSNRVDQAALLGALAVGLERPPRAA